MGKILYEIFVYEKNLQTHTHTLYTSFFKQQKKRIYIYAMCKNQVKQIKLFSDFQLLLLFSTFFSGRFLQKKKQNLMK